MELYSHMHFQPIQLENESSEINARSVQIGSRVGSGVVTELEATPLGIVVRRSPENVRDLLLSPNGVSYIAKKQAQQPAALKR